MFESHSIAMFSVQIRGRWAWW